MRSRIRIKDKSLDKVLDSLYMIEELKGRVGDYICKYRKPTGEIVYLKYGENRIASILNNEVQRLRWLNKKQNRILIPKVEYFKIVKDSAVLIISNIPGEQSQRIAKNIGKKEVLLIVARALKQIHSLDIQKAGRFKDSLEQTLEEYKLLLTQDKIFKSEFIKANNKSPDEILEYLYSEKKLFNEDVFIHGDYCLPNIIINYDKNFGIIDWAKGGLGDRYNDFSAIEGSIKRNFGEEYIELFYTYYGIDYSKVDREKIKYFQLMDQFSYHKK